MTKNVNRRQFLGTSLGSLGFASVAGAVSAPYQRIGEPRLRVGLAAYSFREYFGFMKGKPYEKQPADKQIDMHQFIRYCAKQGVDGAELTSYFFPPEVTKSYLADCRKIAHTTGVSIAGTAVGNNFSYPKDAPERETQMAYVKEWIDHSMIMGAPHIRVFAGKHPKGVSEEQAESNAIEALSEAAKYAGDRGVFLGIENHDSIKTADRLLRVVKAVDSPWVGVNLDTGNFRSDDPYKEMAESAPYAINVQVKMALDIGGKRERSDLDRIGKILRDANYQGFVVLEFEEKDNPFEAVPPALEALKKACG